MFSAEVSNFIKELDNSIEDVYVYGSYYWGHYDEFSDFDIGVKEQHRETFPLDKFGFHSQAKEKINIQADIQFLYPSWINERNLIKIP